MLPTLRSVRRTTGAVAVLALTAGVLAGTPGVAAVAAGEEPTGLALVDLEVEHTADPTGIDVDAPRFSWVVTSEQRATQQKAYRVRVAPAADPDAPVWDTGVVESDESVAVDYAGPALDAATDYVWRVDVATTAGTAGETSGFRTGLYDEADWTGAGWIGNARGEGTDLGVAGGSWIWTPEASPPIAPAEDRAFRRPIPSPAGTRATEVEIVIAADDRFTVAVDGEELGSSTGAENDWQQSRYYSTTAVDPDGPLVAVRTGNGAGSPAGLVAAIRVHYDDGTSEVVRTGATGWTATKTVPAAWADPAYDASGWGAVNVQAPYGQGPWGTGVRAPQRPVNPAPLLRKEFEVAGEVSRATMYYAAGGYADITLDGAPASDEVLTPGFTDYDDTVQYTAVDLTEALEPGTHALGMQLGRGFYGMTGANVWRWERPPWHDEPVVRGVLEIEYADGATEHVVTDDSWTIDDGPTVFDDLYAGETYDASLAQPGWDTVGFDDAGWRAASEVEGPAGELVNQRQQPIRVTEQLEAVEVTEPADGVYVVKFPRVIAGWVRATVTGPAGSEIRYAHGEKLLGNGRVNMSNNGGFAKGFQTDTFRLAGTGGPETFRPSFSYKGFQYIEVTGWPGDGPPPLDAFTAEVLHTDAERTGSFETSSDLMNRTHEAVVDTLYNNLHHIPTDTPMFEKNGWTGDAAVGAEMFLLNTDTHELFAKWMRDVHETRDENGAPLVIAPSSGDWGQWGVATPWHSAYVMIPAWLRQYNGDDRTLRELYDGIAAYVDLEVGRSADGLVTDNRLGDWVSPEASPSGGNAPEDSRVSGTAYLYAMLRSAESSATHLGEDADAARFAAEAETVRDTFNATFFDDDRGLYRGDGDSGYRQTHNVLALAFGLVDPDDEQRVADSIAADVRAKGVHLNTGVLGTKYLLPVLTEHGHADLAYDLAAQVTYPSWGYMIEQGATSMWEHWALEARSRGHYFLGTVEDWYYHYVGGIRPSEDTGYRDVTIAPVVGEELDHADVSTQTPYGEVSSSWRTGEDGFALDVSVPVGSTATVVVPANHPVAVLEGGVPAGDAEGVDDVRAADGEVTMTVASGDYSFTVGPDLLAYGEVLNLLDAVGDRAGEHRAAGDLSESDHDEVVAQAGAVADLVGEAVTAHLAGDTAAEATALDGALAGARGLRDWLDASAIDLPVRGDLGRRVDVVVRALEALASDTAGVSIALVPLTDPVLPGDTATGTLTVTNSGDEAVTDVDATVEVGDWVVEGPPGGPDRLAPGTSVDLAFTVEVPAGARPGEVEASAEAAYARDGVTRIARDSTAWATVTSSLEVATVAASAPDPARPEAGAASVTVVNDGPRSVDARVELGLPDGWGEAPPSLPVTVPAEDSVDVEVPFWVPREVVATSHEVTAEVVRGDDVLARGAGELSVALATPPAESEGAVDHVDLGEPGSEQDHAVLGSPSSGTSTEAGLTRRYANSTVRGSWYSMLVDVPAAEPFTVRMRETFDGATTKEFNLYVDEVFAGRHSITRTASGQGWLAHQVVVDGADALAATGDGEARLRFEFPTDASGYDPSIADVWVLPDTADDLTPLSSVLVDSDLPGRDGWHRAPVSATVVAADNRPGPVTVEVGAETGWAAYDGPLTFAEDGEHRVDWRARDTAGNATGARSVPIRVDATAPVTETTVEVVEPDRAELRFLASDATSGVASTRYRVDGGAWQTAGDGPVVLEGAGDRLLEYSSVDVAGNTETVRTARVDLAEPAPDAISVVAAPQVLGTATVGRVLRATDGTWSETGVRLRRQWLRDGTPIAGARAARYRVRPADAGRRIAVRVTATKTGHESATVRSASTSPVRRAAAVTVVRAPAAVASGRLARLRVAVDSTVTPAGRVGIRVGGRTVRVVRLDSGRASVSVRLPRPGRHRVVAHYRGNAGVAPATSAPSYVRQLR